METDPFLSRISDFFLCEEKSHDRSRSDVYMYTNSWIHIVEYNIFPTHNTRYFQLFLATLDRTYRFTEVILTSDIRDAYNTQNNKYLIIEDK